MRRSIFYILLCIALVTIGCCQTQPVVLPYANVSFNDSLVFRWNWLFDTTIIDHYREISQRGDTVYIIDSTNTTHTHVETKGDTVYKTQVDTIYVSVEVPIEVPGKISKGNRFLINSGIALWIIAGILLIAIIIGIIFKIAKR